MDYTMDSMRSNTISLSVNNISKALKEDTSHSTLYEQMGIHTKVSATCSGQSDNDYPNFTTLPTPLNKLAQITPLKKVPLPAEILDRFRSMQCNSLIGLFSEINRGWVTIDSDIYVWSYVDGSDVAYFDGLNETILCVGLIRPKVGVFHPFIKYLLVLTTATDIVVLGVTFTTSQLLNLEEIQLVPDPVFTIPTDGATITTIVGSDCGRFFLGTKDGCLLEIVYQAQSSWFGKRCKKINHSTSSLSFLVPSFLNAALTEDDAVSQISIDNSRHILYVLTVKGSIGVYDLGEQGNTLSKIIKLSQSYIVQQAVQVVRGLDSQSFYPIVSISAVEASESIFVNVVAVSSTGVRFYFSVNNFLNLQASHNKRPSTLMLVHVRLPPGFSALPAPRPRGVQVSHYKQSSLMCITSLNEVNTLWCMSSDIFPFNSKLMEAYTTIQLDGSVWAMAEIKQPSEIVPKQLTYEVLPPVVVRQHYEPPRKFVVLTAQGAQIFIKLRPIDMLRQLLLDCRGPDNEAVKTFFMILRQDQACATSLILGCLENIQNTELADWATRAFFLYGGEPKSVQYHQQQPLTPGQQTGYSASTSFLPNVMSTPLSPHLQQQLNYSTNSFDQSNFSSNTNLTSTVYSARHNGLYLYLARILGPIWDKHILETRTVTSTESYLNSNLPSETCSWILSHLLTLKTFILKNTQLIVTSTSPSAYQHSSFNMSSQTLTSSKFNSSQTIQDSEIQERQSLEAFKYLLLSCCQVLGLWKILCEHQLHLFINYLTDQEKHILQGFTFRDLVINGHDICIRLINLLITSYLTDNAAIDSISLKLRDTCPDFYKDEDAVSSKVYEMLKDAKFLKNQEEKEEVILAAMQLIKTIAPNIKLHEICSQLVALEAYHAATDICVTCAKKLDPDCIAEYSYKNSTDVMTSDNFSYFSQRMRYYKEVISILDELHNRNKIDDAVKTKHDFPSAITNDANTDDMVLRVIYDILTFDDELLHVAVYEWMIIKKFDSAIIKIKQPTLEKYLIKASEQSQENANTLNLLWKYYESCDNHASAAKVLHNLAIKKDNGLTLKDRLGNLARAVMCMRAEHVGYAPTLGIFLRDLEDKLEMAKVQEQVLNSIINLEGRMPDVPEAVAALNNGLYDLTQLYEEFAEKFNLWQCKLAIIDCAGYKEDAALVETIWQNIIDAELQVATGSSNDKILQVLSTVLILIRRYKPDSICIPLPYIITKLEIISIKLCASADLVPITLITEIPYQILVPIYNELIISSFSDRFWTRDENEYHLAESFAGLVNKFLDNEQQVDNHSRLKIKQPCEDTIAKLLSTFYSKPDADHLINLLKTVQARLSK